MRNLAERLLAECRAALGDGALVAIGHAEDQARQVEREPDQRPHRPVVELPRDPAPLRVLRAEQALRRVVERPLRSFQLRDVLLDDQHAHLLAPHAAGVEPEPAHLPGAWYGYTSRNSSRSPLATAWNPHATSSGS